MFTTHDILFGVALPFGVALLTLAVIGGWRWGVGLGLGAAYVAGYIALFGLPGVKPAGGDDRTITRVITDLLPHEASEWTVVLAIAAVVIGLLVSCRCVSDGAAWLARLLLTFGLVNAVLWPMIDLHWDKTQALVYTQAITCIILVAWWSLDELAERVTGATLPLVLTVTVAAAGALPLLGGSQTLGQKTGILAAALLGAFMVGLFRGSMSLARGGVAVIVTITAALLLCSAFYAEGVPLWAVLTVGLAPLLAWVAATRPFRSLRPWTAALLTLILVLIPLTAAVGPLAMEFAQSMTAEPDPYQSLAE